MNRKARISISSLAVFGLASFVLILAVIIGGILVIVYGLPYPENKNSIFPNHYLEEAVRQQIDKPSGEIQPEDCIDIKELDLSAADFNVSLEGLQYFINLEKLTSDAGNLSDISALSNLKKLKYLKLYKNRISDLSPLSGLKSLEYLDLYDNNVTSIVPLESLSSLNRLFLGKNIIKDVSPLKGLKNLQYLEIYGKYAQNLDILRGNSNLEIEDLSPQSTHGN